MIQDKPPIYICLGAYYWEVNITSQFKEKNNNRFEVHCYFLGGIGGLTVFNFK